MDALKRLLPTWQARARARRSRGGQLQTIPAVRSPQLDNTRDILVWLPAYYRRSGKRYPVIYMHDGQNLFDPRTSFAGDWSVGEAVGWAARRGHEAIVVGIPNTGIERANEYSPFVEPGKGGGKGDAYLDFVIDTVKPMIDLRYRTLPGRDHTGIAGSSLGGLITQYAFFSRPDIFGFAAVLSPAFWFGEAAILDFVKAAPAAGGRLYLDVGHHEGQGTLHLTRTMRDVLIEKGYELSKTLRFVEDREGRHMEADWGRRFRKALPFLLRREGA